MSSNQEDIYARRPGESCSCARLNAREGATLAYYCSHCPPKTTPTPAAMLGEALKLIQRALVLVDNAALDIMKAPDKRGSEATKPCPCGCHVNIPDLHCLRCAPAPRPTLFGAPIVEDPSVPAGHVDMERRDGTRVRFDLRTAAERMEAEAKRAEDRLMGRRP